MKAFISRLRKLENAAVPHLRDQAQVEAILEARRRRLGASYEAPAYPEGSFAGCRTVADRILRTRQLLMARKRMTDVYSHEDDQPTTPEA